MPGGAIAVTGTSDVNRVEAPVTVRAYLIVAFAAFGGIFFGYDTGWMGGVLNMDYFIKQYTGAEYPDVHLPNGSAEEITKYRNQTFKIPPQQQSLVTSILSAGTFLGAIMAGDLADFIGRRFTIILGCAIFTLGGILETASTGLGVMVAGRLFAGFGVGFISAIVILYMSEIAPRKVRGAVVAGYQFCITIGILLATCVVYATQGRRDTGSYRIPIAVQFLWAIILAVGLALLPESPRFYVKKVIGEIFPLTIRSRGVGLSTASNWFWNCIIGLITPYLVDALGSHVFFMWGGLCCVSFLFALFLVPETKGLTLEQVDKMLEETTPFTSRKWKPHSTFASEMHLGEKNFELRAGQSAVPKTHATESVVPTTHGAHGAVPNTYATESVIPKTDTHTTV